MKLHRFYVDDTELTHSFWMKDAALCRQWTKVLRFQVGREVVLFDNHEIEKLYRIEQIGVDAVKVALVTEMVPLKPKRELYLCFSLLKKDKNDWVLQKGCELGVRHFIPLLCDRTEKTGFNIERAEKIVIEAAEQSGRADIPKVREPITLPALISELLSRTTIAVSERGSEIDMSHISTDKPMAVLVGPEGGWSDEEKAMFAQYSLPHIALSPFTLRAETACVIAASLSTFA